MNIIDQLKSGTLNLLKPLYKNSMTLPQEFMRYGNRDMYANYSEAQLSDADLYTGYGYAAIRTRANIVARTALENVRTESNIEEYKHPYLDLIYNSKFFTEYQFWNTISTYLDLEGVYYLMAVRAIAPNRVGNIQYFKLLNPYNIKRVVNKETLEVSGYIESRKGLIREIPPEQIIEIRELNPFDEDKPYAITDAAKESQFTLKTANDFTRSALKNNANAPGILSTDVQLEEADFKNFVEKVRQRRKGEPIFSNGSGGITWEAMNQDLDKSALKDVNEINRDQLLAVGGVSKTMVGIEQSGTTRETSRVQKELNMENQTLPRIQLILDSLNLDFQTNYQIQRTTTKAYLVVDNPMAVEFDSKIKEVEFSDKQFDLYQKLINRGIDKDMAAQYIRDEIEIEMLNIEPQEIPDFTATTTTEENRMVKKNNQLERDPVVRQQEAGLQNAVVNIDGRITSAVINKFPKAYKNSLKIDNAFESISDILNKSDIKEAVSDLSAVLVTFYGVIESIKGSQVANERQKEFNLPALFTLDKEANRYIKSTSKKVAESHVDTVANDLLKVVREASAEGLSEQQVISLIKTKYSGDITEGRAKVIARTEANRAFTRAQFEADRQFIDLNKLEGKVFKQWITRSSDPCAFCLDLANRGPIPFSDNFVDLGGHISVDGKTLDVDFESLQAGNAHPNCSCAYKLIIE